MSSAHETTTAPLLGEPLPVELMNTIWADRAGVHDALSTDAEVLAWLRAVGSRLADDMPAVSQWLAADKPQALDQTAAQIRRLRDALRKLTAETTRDPRTVAASAITDANAAAAVLNQATAASPTWPVLDWADGIDPTRTVRFAGPAGPAVVSFLAAAFVDSVAAGGGVSLRACLAPGCVLYFAKDHTRREWCSAACGNRARAARHYHRRKAASEDDDRRGSHA